MTLDEHNEPIWSEYPRLMLEKVAEEHALDRASQDEAQVEDLKALHVSLTEFAMAKFTVTRPGRPPETATAWHWGLTHPYEDALLAGMQQAHESKQTVTLDDGTMIEPEATAAPVIRAWLNPSRPHWQYCLYPDLNRITPARPIFSAADMVAYLRHDRPGHTIDLSAEPPGGWSDGLANNLQRPNTAPWQA